MYSNGYVIIDEFDYCTKIDALCMRGCPLWTLHDGHKTKIG